MELTLEQALQKGIEAHKAGKVQEADRYYTAILKANSKHPDANHNMGVLAVGIGKVQEALPFFKTALEANPKIEQFWLSYIDALIKLDRMVDAKSVFDQARSNGAEGDGFDQVELQLNTSSVHVKNEIQEDIQTPSNILDQLELGQALKLANKKTKDGLSEDAKKIYQDILNKFPKNKRALDGMKALATNVLANTSAVEEPATEQFQSLVSLHTQEQYQETLNKSYQLVEQFPCSSNIYNIIGAANQGLGKLDEAIEAYKKALSLKPNSAEAHNNMGTTLVDQGKIDKAIEAYKKALSIKPTYPDAYYNMGNALKKQGKLEEAIEAYNKVLSIKPDYARAYNNIGTTLKEQGKLGEALEAYNEAISIKPDYAEAYNNMGVSLEDQGKHGKALEAYNIAISIKPDYAEAYYNMGNALQDQGKPEEAIEAYKKAISINPDHGSANHMLSALTGNKNETAPREYVESLFDGYSKKFEASLVDQLEYKVPKLIKNILIEPNSQRSLGSVLDLGCGSGLLGRELRDHCSQLQGIDVSSQMLDLAKQKNVYDQLSHFDIVEYLSSRPLSFDYYMALDVFIYVGELTEIFRLIKSRNKKPGYLVFSTEHTELDGYHILKTGRYAHSRSYIETLCKEFDYNVDHFSTNNLRKEKDNFLTGGIYILSF